MPYRRIPNTDTARLKALNRAYAKGKELPPFKLAFSQVSFNRIQAFLTSFESTVRLYRNTQSNTILKNREYPVHFKKAKLYISHFIQVMNMAIARGELSPSIRAFYGIAEDNNKVPAMHNETDLINWGERVIAGEMERIRKGMNPITNPTIAVVKVRYEQFLETYRTKEISKKSNVRIQNDVASLREQADDIILNIWNEIEAYFSELEEDEMRRNCMEYGVVYVYRKGERERERQS
ncbi:MAG: hypothetical protein LBF89_04250 [Bacteroidales bacterium]|jgi:hypothetical protein|nr:hypothetical protein [Bacteroidales bacterium]